MKVRASIFVEKDILEKSHDLGINVSKVCENALKISINAMQNATQQITPETQTETENNQDNEGKRGNRRFSQWTGRDLNPRPPDCESGVHTKLNYRPGFLSEENVDWDGIKSFRLCFLV